MPPKKEVDAQQRLARDMDKKAAWSEALQERQETLRKTEKLRALRLEREEAERLEQKDQPAKPARKKPAKRKGA